MPGIQGVPPGERQHAFLELYRNSAHLARYGDRFDHDLHAVVDGSRKLVVSDRGERHMFRIDGFGEASIPVPDTSDVDHLAGLVTAHQKRVGRVPSQPAVVDPETLESLRSLGYTE